MNRSEYYDGMKVLARQVRQNYSLRSPRVMRSDMRRIYRDQGIRIDLWPWKLRELRGAYFNDDCGVTVMLARGLPNEPAIFTMAHELKHHLADDIKAAYYCADSNTDDLVEIGAEVFAAELIFPQADFIQCLTDMNVTRDNFQPDQLIHLKRKSATTMSYSGLVKRAEFLGYAIRGSLRQMKWKKREEELYGEPVYKRIQRDRRARAQSLVS